jgi:hypothetical protein
MSYTPPDLHLLDLLCRKRVVHGALCMIVRPHIVLKLKVTVPSVM